MVICRAHKAGSASLAVGAAVVLSLWVAGCAGGGERGESAGAVERGSPRALLREAVEVVSREAMGAERVDWEVVWTELSAGVPERGRPAEAHGAIGEVVRRLDDRHASFRAAAGGDGASGGPTGSGSGSGSGGSGGGSGRVIPEVPEGRVLADGVGYLVMPGCAAGDVEGLRRYARAARDEIARLSAAGVRGWVIDVRLNGGGNVWPMLLGAAPLLGDGAVMATVREDRDGPGVVVSRYGVTGDHGAWIDWGRGFETQLSMADGSAEASWGRRSDREPIAVVLGPWTMSSGEALALALISARGARTFGEPTAGLTTITNVFALSDGSTLVLPVARMAWLDGTPLPGGLTPDVMVEFAGWPEAGDWASESARRWVAERARAGRGADVSGGGR